MVLHRKWCCVEYEMSRYCNSAMWNYVDLCVTSGQVVQRLGVFWWMSWNIHGSFGYCVSTTFHFVCTLHLLQDAFYNFFQIKKVCTFVAAHASMKIIQSTIRNFAFHIKFPLTMAWVDRNISEGLREWVQYC